MTENRIIHLGDDAFGLEVWTIGARLNDLRIDGHGGLLARAESPADALGDARNFGAVVGPVANRLARAEAPVGETVHRLQPNENGRTICHSGIEGVNSKLWSVVEETAERLTLALEIAEGADGFPGNRRLSATYALVERGFDLTFEATSDAATLMNLALHPYWSLNRSGREGQTIMVNAESYLPIDGDKIPTGEIAPVAGTIFDLRNPVGASPGIDHNYCLTGDAPAAILTAENGLVLTITTDAPGLQVYTDSPVGIAVEPQLWPDAPHHPDFPSILLEHGQRFRQHSSYRFSSS